MFTARNSRCTSFPTGVAGRARQSLGFGLDKFLRFLFQRTATVGLISAIGQKIAIFRIGDEQKMRDMLIHALEQIVKAEGAAQ